MNTHIHHHPLRKRYAPSHALFACLLLASVGGLKAQLADTIPCVSTNNEVPTAPGICGVDPGGNAVELLPTLSSRTRLKGVFGMAFSFGIAHARALAYLKGEHAATRLPRSTTFHFRFAPDASAFGRDTHLPSSVPTASSPAEFMLVRMEATRGDRRFQYGRYSLASTETGAPSEQNVPFTIARISADEFEVTVPDLLPGEYAWLWMGDLQHASGPLRVHEFGIDPEREVMQAPR